MIDFKSFSNYHTHTEFCDGRSTAEEMVLSAIKNGCEEIGFTSHSYTFFDESYCMSIEGTERYKECILELREKYKGQIKILLGLEQDYYSEYPTEGFDYIIGSVHYVKAGDVYIPVDESRDIQINAVREHFGGDFLSFVEAYYNTVGNVYEKTGCSIVGHFDLVTKYNKNNCLFDVNCDRCQKAMMSALEKLIAAPCAIEINTGALARGHKTEPYPGEDIIKLLRERGKRVVVNSDCHDAENLTFAFEKYTL